MAGACSGQQLLRVTCEREAWDEVMENKRDKRIKMMGKEVRGRRVKQQ